MTQIELKLCFRNFIYVFFAFVFPPMMLLLFGAMYGNEPSQYTGGVGTVDFSTPAYIGMLIAVSGIMGLPIALSEYRSRKVLKRYKATPVGKLTILAPQLIVNALICILGLTLLIIVGVIVFDLKFHGGLIGVFYFIIAFILSRGAIFSIGFLIAATAPNSQSAMAISFALYFVMLFLSGATVPLSIMPKAITIISKGLPLTYCVELLQGVWLGGAIWEFWIPIVILSSITIVCMVLSIKFFKWE